MMEAIKIRKQIKGLVIFFILGIALSGLTAFPLEAEIVWLCKYSAYLPDSFANWLNAIKDGIVSTNRNYPFIAYGTDWLAFAHLIIGLLFIGVLKDPIINRWIVDWAMMCCVLVLPLAFIAGPVRHIPLFHQLIDCSFGVVGIIPLAFLKRKISRLEKITA